MVDDLALLFRPSCFVVDFEAAVYRVLSEEVPGKCWAVIGDCYLSLQCRVLNYIANDYGSEICRTVPLNKEQITLWNHGITVSNGKSRFLAPTSGI